MLKAAGLTPLQVAGMFLIQHLLLPGAGVLAGLGAIEAFGAWVSGPLGQAMAVWRTLPSQGWVVPVSVLVTVATGRAPVVCRGLPGDALSNDEQAPAALVGGCRTDQTRLRIAGIRDLADKHLIPDEAQQHDGTAASVADGIS